MDDAEGLYGLELTRNSKVGWAFSVSRKESCIGATEACRALCYGNGVRYKTKGARRKRERNFRTVERLLALGGPELLADNLVHLIDMARPTDWLVAKLSGVKTKVPWTLRLFDVGDVHRAEVAYAWWLAAIKRPECVLWFYSRSFVEPEILKKLALLAELPNVRGFLSLDRENYKEGLKAFKRYPEVFSVAVMQEKPSPQVKKMLLEIERVVPEKRLVVFPVHKGAFHVEPLKTRGVVCPQVLGQYELVNEPDREKPCQSCRVCLPRPPSQPGV